MGYQWMKLKTHARATHYVSITHAVFQFRFKKSSPGHRMLPFLYHLSFLLLSSFWGCHTESLSLTKLEFVFEMKSKSLNPP